MTDLERIVKELTTPEGDITSAIAYADMLNEEGHWLAEDMSKLATTIVTTPDPMTYNFVAKMFLELLKIIEEERENDKQG